MRSADEQLRLVRSKAAKLRRRQRSRLTGAAAVCCLALVLFLGFLLPGGDGGVSLPEGATFGSLVMVSPKLSYVVVAILAFALGLCVTMLCIYRRERRGKSEDDDS